MTAYLLLLPNPGTLLIHFYLLTSEHSELNTQPLLYSPLLTREHLFRIAFHSNTLLTTRYPPFFPPLPRRLPAHSSSVFTTAVWMNVIIISYVVCISRRSFKLCEATSFAPWPAWCLRTRTPTAPERRCERVARRGSITRQYRRGDGSGARRPR